jgi:threonylcarbamoyladenosine tRNA methylthiotransferase MtaB
MADPVPVKTRQNRSKMLRNLSVKKRRAFYESQLGKSFHVLFEDDVENGMMHGFTENYVRVQAKYDPLLINELKQVSLIDIADSGFVEVSEPEMITI